LLSPALRRFLPYTAAAMTVAWLAIAGVPPFAGFWAKDAVLEAAFVNHDYGIWAVGVIATVMTGWMMAQAAPIAVCLYLSLSSLRTRK